MILRTSVLSFFRFSHSNHVVFAAGERAILNILLLGETGTGKTTWINAFANYISFETLAKAEDAGGMFPIRATFNMFNPDTYEGLIIASDKNVLPTDHAAVHSVTQEPRTYSFTHGAMAVNVIDTPGLFSTKDVLNETHSMDKQHVENILHFIGRFDKLHAICVFLKPNQPRITPSIEYCVTEILRNLHESASNNVIFIITNAKSTNFKPGNTISTLRDFLRRNLLETRIELNKDTIYYFENDTVQHIAEHINGCSHDNDAEESTRKSWEKSVKTMTDMLANIQKLPPHDVDSTQCIYSIRRLIGILSNVLFEVVTCGVDNLETIEKKRKEISKRRSEIQNSPEDFVPEDLQNVLYTKIQKIDVRKLEHSNTVCKSPQCSLVVGNKRHFRQICCEKCTGFITLWTCRAFEGITGAKCRHCKCERAMHQWQATKTELKKEVLFDRSEEGIDKVLNRDDALRELNAYCEKLEKSTSQIANEQKQMLETGAILSLFLQKNAILSGTASDNLGTCLRNEYEAFKYATLEIGQEKKRQITNTDAKEVDSMVKEDMLVATQHTENLQKLIKEYDEYYNKASDSGKFYTTPEVRRVIDELYRLPENGETLKAAVLEIEKCQQLAVQNEESKTSIAVRKITTRVQQVVWSISGRSSCVVLFEFLP